MFQIIGIVCKSEDIAGCNLIDDLCWCKSIYLIRKNMFQSILFIGELLLHFLALIQPLYDLCNIQTGLHIKINKCLVLIIETSRILFFQHIYHTLYDILRGEDLVRLLRRDIVKDIFNALLIKVICQLLL